MPPQKKRNPLGDLEQIYGSYTEAVSSENYLGLPLIWILTLFVEGSNQVDTY